MRAQEGRQGQSLRFLDDAERDAPHLVHGDREDLERVEELRAGRRLSERAVRHESAKGTVRRTSRSRNRFQPMPMPTILQDLR